MRNFVIRVVINAIAIWVATLLIPKVTIDAENTTRTVVSLLVIGAMFGIVNALIKPVVQVLTLPFYLLTFGLMAFVVNALMLELAGWLSTVVGISFNSGPFFWSTILAAIVVSLVSTVLGAVLPEDD
jgi:putative membrane protein